MTKPLFDPIVVKNSQSDGSLANSTSTNEGDRNEVLGKIDYPLDQLVASEEGPRWRRWGFSRYAGLKSKILGPLVVKTADLF